MNIKGRLTENDKILLGEEFTKRFDSKNTSFFIRIDKENLSQDSFKITDSANAVKIMIKLRAFTKQAEFEKFLVDKGILGYKQ